MNLMAVVLIASFFGGFALSVKFRKLRTSLILWFFIGFIPIYGKWCIYCTDRNDLEFIMFCFIYIVILFLLSQAIRGVFKEVKNKVDINRVAGVVGIIAGIVLFIVVVNSVSFILGILWGAIGGFVVFAVVRWLVLGFVTLEEAKSEKAGKKEP